MLIALRIKNLALVEDLSLEWKEGFNVITGETGAGKSILIGALNLALGERADRSLVRTGAEGCMVEALFDARHLSLPSLFEEFGLELPTDAQLILKRSFTLNGTNRQWINGSPATLQALKQMGELLVDIHGPHDHQSLLRPEVQLEILDRFAGLEKLRLECAENYRTLKKIEERRRDLVVDESEFQRRLDLLAYQAHEIEAARLLPDEETELEKDYQRASNSQKLLDLVNRAQQALSEGETTVLSLLNQAQRALKDLASMDSKAASFEEANAGLISQFQELSREVEAYASKVDLDPERLHALSERMTLIQGMKRKYGKTLAEVIEFGEKSRKELKQIQGRAEELAKIEKEAQAAAQAMEKGGKSLSVSRSKAIPKLAKVVMGHLHELGFLQSHFDAELKPCEPSLSGIDTLEFRFAPNPGEPPRSLREIASSGEMARVMLALKTALAAQDKVPVLVFDEVDANIGGEIGNRVGEKMTEIGKKHQVLCITHLPQVAVHSGHHHVVLKSVEKGRTFTKIEPLPREKRPEEIARMLGGKTDSALKHAREMLKQAGNG